MAVTVIISRFEHLEHRDGSKQGTARQSFPDWYTPYDPYYPYDPYDPYDRDFHHTGSTKFPLNFMQVPSDGALVHGTQLLCEDLRRNQRQDYPQECGHKLLLDVR